MKHNAQKPGGAFRKAGDLRRKKTQPHKNCRLTRRFVTTDVLVLTVGLISLILLLLGALLPPFISSVAAFMLFMIPGLVLSRLALEDEDFPGAARLPVAFVISTGVLGLLGVPALIFHLSIETYLLACGIVLAASFGLAIYGLIHRDIFETVPEEDPASNWLWIPFIGLSGMLSYTSTVRMERPNGDSWIYLAYVQDYVDSANLTFNNVLVSGLATDGYMSFRTSINGWLLEQAAMSRISGTPPVDLVLSHLAPMLVLVSLLAVYALSTIFFGREAALLIGTLTALFFLVDLHATLQTAFLSPGHEMMNRVTEDKFVVRFLFLPVALGVAALYLRKRKLRYLLLFTFICWSVFTVHPIGLILIGIGIIGFSFFHLAVNLLDKRAWLEVFGLGAALSSVTFPLVIYLLATNSRLLSRFPSSNPRAADNGTIMAWVAAKRLMVLGDDVYIVHPAVLLSPAILAAYVLGIPFLIFHLRKNGAARLLLGMLVSTPLLIYVPPISTRLAEIVGPWVLPRFSWPVSLAAPLVLGWMFWKTLVYLQVWLTSSRLRVPVPSLAGTLLPLLLVTTLIVGTTPVIVASLRSANETGEVLQSESTCYDPTFTWLQSRIKEPATVLAPYDENSCIPARSAANVLSLRGMSPSNTERKLRRFFNSHVLDERGIQTLLNYEVDYILLAANSPLNAQFRHLPGFAALDNPGNRYNVYVVDPQALTVTNAVYGNTLLNTQLKNGNSTNADAFYEAAQNEGPDEQFLAYMGLGLWNSRQDLYSDAAANYEQALSIDPGEPTLYPLLSSAYNSAGAPDLARLALENGVDRFPEDVEIRTALSELLMLQDPEAAVEVQKEVVEMFPEVPEYRIQLGTLLALNGSTEAADRQFEYAIRKDPLSAQLHADVGLANQISGRSKAAIQHYERALKLDPSLQEVREQLEVLRQEE